MKRLTTLFIALLCIQTLVQAMEPQKELDLKWTFACVSHLRNAKPTNIQITGISPLEVHIRPSQAHKAQLQQAFLGSLEAVTMQDGVSLDMTKLIAFADIIKTVQAEHEQQEKEALLPAAIKIALDNFHGEISYENEFNGITAGRQCAQKIEMLVAKMSLAELKEKMKQAKKDPDSRPFRNSRFSSEITQEALEILLKEAEKKLSNLDILFNFLNRYDQYNWSMRNFYPVLMHDIALFKAKLKEIEAKKKQKEVPDLGFLTSI